MAPDKATFCKNRYDIVGDIHHGDFTLNKIIAGKTDVRRLLLHSCSIEFFHPGLNKQVEFSSPVPDDFYQVLETKY